MSHHHPHYRQVHSSKSGIYCAMDHSLRSPLLRYPFARHWNPKRISLRWAVRRRLRSKSERAGAGLPRSSRWAGEGGRSPGLLLQGTGGGKQVASQAKRSEGGKFMTYCCPRRILAAPRVASLGRSAA